MCNTFSQLPLNIENILDKYSENAITGQAITPVEICCSQCSHLFGIPGIVGCDDSG